MIEGLTKEEMKTAVKVLEAFEARARENLDLAKVEQDEADTTDAKALAEEGVDYFTKQLRDFMKVSETVFVAMKRTKKAAVQQATKAHVEIEPPQVELVEAPDDCIEANAYSKTGTLIFSKAYERTAKGLLEATRDLQAVSPKIGRRTHSIMLHWPSYGLPFDKARLKTLFAVNENEQEMLCRAYLEQYDPKAA